MVGIILYPSRSNYIYSHVIDTECMSIGESYPVLCNSFNFIYIRLGWEPDFFWLPHWLMLRQWRIFFMPSVVVGLPDIHLLFAIFSVTIYTSSGIHFLYLLCLPSNFPIPLHTNECKFIWILFKLPRFETTN